MTAEELARLRPDTPQWLDLRGLLLSGRADVFAGGDPARGFVVRSWDLPVAVAAGEPGPAEIRAAASGGAAGSEWHLLAPAESVRAVAATLPDWPQRGVTLHARDEGAPLPSIEPRVAADFASAPRGWEAAGLSLDHLPDELGAEYRTEGVRGHPLVAALVGGRAVSFCWAAVATEGLWDVAVDTLADHRRQGLAAVCFVKLARLLAARGLRPVWGALDENAASMRLAARLGFRPVAALTSFLRPPAARGA